MIYIKKPTKAKTPRETIKARFVRFTSDEKGTINVTNKEFNYVDALFMKIDDKGQVLYKKNDKGQLEMNDKGVPKVDWLQVRIYPTDKDKKAVSLNTFPEIIKADKLAEEIGKKEGDKIFPLVQFESYKTLAEVKGVIYKNYKMSLPDMKSFKILDEAKPIEAKPIDTKPAEVKK